MNQPESLAWQPYPDAWLLAVLLLGGYFWALAAWGSRRDAGPPATRRQKLYFVLGVAAIWVGTDWPVGAIADDLFSVHMLQHLLYSFVAAPLLILGTPGWLLRRLLAPAPVRHVWTLLTRPLVALVLFNAWATAYHWPALVDLSVSNDLVHLSVHVAWVLAGLVMWWPVLSPLPEMAPLPYPLAMAYLFGQSVLPTIPASFLTFGNHAYFATYADTAPLWGLDAIVDQQLAGLLMKVGGGLLLWGVIAALFFLWFHEQETGGPDIRYWRDVERALGPASSPRAADSTGDHEPPG